MRILYHHRTLGDGAEGIHVAAMVDAFSRLGHDVHVSAMIGERTNHSTRRTRTLSAVARRLPRAAYECLEVGYNAIGYRSLAGHIKGWNPHFIYERYILHNMAGVLVAKRKSLPLVLEVNAPLALERATYERLSWKEMARRTERYICARATVVLAVSTPLKQHLIDEGVAADRIVVLPNAADPAVFKPDVGARQAVRARLGIPADAIVAGFAGILRPWHGVELLIDAAAQLPIAERPHLLIVGDGPSRCGLEQLARKLHIERHVTFTGRVPHAEIPRYLAAFDLGVSPRATFYASPMKVPEYMAAGMAVVAPRMRNLEDLISDRTNGLLFAPEDSGDLAKALGVLVRDEQLRLRLSSAARSEITQRRTWIDNARQVVDLVAQNVAMAA